MTRFVYGFALVVLGALVSLYALIRLGFGRHGRAWFDVSYLANPLTAAHAANLVCLIIGGACVLAGGWFIVSGLRKT